MPRGYSKSKRRWTLVKASGSRKACHRTPGAGSRHFVVVSVVQRLGDVRRFPGSAVDPADTSMSTRRRYGSNPLKGRPADSGIIPLRLYRNRYRQAFSLGGPLPPAATPADAGRREEPALRGYVLASVTPVRGWSARRLPTSRDVIPPAAQDVRSNVRVPVPTSREESPGHPKYTRQASPPSTIRRRKGAKPKRAPAMRYWHARTQRRPAIHPWRRKSLPASVLSRRKGISNQSCSLFRWWIRMRPGSTIHKHPTGDSWETATAIWCMSLCIPPRVGRRSRKTISPEYFSGG